MENAIESAAKCSKCGALLAINEGYQDEETKEWTCYLCENKKEEQ